MQSSLHEDVNILTHSHSNLIHWAESQRVHCLNLSGMSRERATESGIDSTTHTYTRICNHNLYNRFIHSRCVPVFFPSFSVPSCAIYMYVQQYWVVIRFCYSSFFFLLSFCLLSAFFSVWILYLTALRLSQKNEKAPLHNRCLCVMCAWTNAHARISHLTIRLINWDFFSL